MNWRADAQYIPERTAAHENTVTDKNRVIFALALESMDGVGRVTAGRVLEHFPSYEALLQYPREQVLLRLRGAPRAETLVKTLFDESHFRQRLTDAQSRVEGFRGKRIDVIATGDTHWPPGLADLPRASRPNVLYAYGDLEKLKTPLVSFLARPPLEPESFELAQELVRHLMRHRIPSVAGTANGFDVVVHRIAATCPDLVPSVAVAGCGLARVPPNLRPVLAASVRSGGLMLSSFAPSHGPFDHDDRERALIMAALARAPVFVQPHPGTQEHHALEWALSADRPVFVIGTELESVPSGTAPIAGEADFGRVTEICRQRT